MPTNLEISIGFIESFVGLAIVLFAAGTVWGSLKRAVSNIEKTIDRAILPGLEEIREAYGGGAMDMPTDDSRRAERISARALRTKEGETIIFIMMPVFTTTYAEYPRAPP